MFPELFKFCNSNGGSEISFDELNECSRKLSSYFNVPDSYQVYYRDFINKYWHLIDVDGSGSLNFDEYKNQFVGFAMADAGLSLQVK